MSETKILVREDHAVAVLTVANLLAQENAAQTMFILITAIVKLSESLDLDLEETANNVREAIISYFKQEEDMPTCPPN